MLHYCDSYKDGEKIFINFKNITITTNKLNRYMQTALCIDAVFCVMRNVNH